METGEFHHKIYIFKKVNYTKEHRSFFLCQMTKLKFFKIIRLQCGCIFVTGQFIIIFIDTELLYNLKFANMNVN